MKTEEILKIINAYKEGKTIEFRFKFDLDTPSNRSYEWDYEVPSSGDYNWNFAMYEYRIKEEPKLQPYKNTKEFFRAMKEHGPAIGDGIVAIRATSDGIYYYSVLSEEIVFLGYSGLACLKWQDGTPCGILED